MNFMGMERLMEGLPFAHIYYHKVGLEEVFGGLDNARSYVRQYLESQREYHEHRYQFLLAGVWGDCTRFQKVIDLAGFSDMNPWPGNPDIELWNIRNGLFTPDKTLVCGDFALVLASEEEVRRQAPDLDYFAHKAVPRLR